jgi:hypothetical protein
MGVGAKIGQRILTVLNSNPLAWFLLFVALMSGYGNYKQAKDLERICELSGPHGDVVAVAKTKQEKLANLCAGRKVEDDDDDDDDDEDDDDETKKTKKK